MAKKGTEDKKFTSDEEIQTLLKIKSYKEICEENIVGILYKEPELYFYNDNLKVDDFSSSKFKLYFQIGYDIIIKEQKILDENTIDIYLHKHSDMNKKYENYGGFETIRKVSEIVKKENLEGYIKELNKWNVVSNMAKAKFPVAHRLKDYVDMDAEEIYSENEAILNHLFINVSSSIKTYDIADDLEGLIESLDKGHQIGLPYYSLNMFTHETNGMSLGDMLLFLASSGAGKSSFIRSTVIPSVLEMGEKLLIMVNEENHLKQKSELLIWVATNILEKPIKKHILNSGNFDKKTKEILHEAKEWIEQHKGQIIIAVIDSYTTDKAIKMIKKYASLGVKYFVLDTFKHDSTAKTDAAWLDLQLNSVKLYDLIKSANKNVCLICTMQLTKQSVKQRYLTLDSVSSAKNVVDVCAGVVQMRWVLPDEYPDERNELKVYKTVGKTKLPISLKKDRRYQVLFLNKNRYGTTAEYQIVLEVDLSTNKFREIGITYIMPDF